MSDFRPHDTFSSDLPARLVTTELDWHDLVLPAAALAQLDEIALRIRDGAALLESLGVRAPARPGFAALFHGPRGTGKTLAACLLGKRCGLEVYTVDLSRVVSKFIGETEKNLARIFDAASHKESILFFDEADALFGKRTGVADAHDRHANAEVGYLLQRIEAHHGVAILASNFRAGIGDAFVRRFRSVVYFPLPKAEERLRLWRQALPESAALDERIDLGRIAERYELSGGAITNAVRHASLLAASRGERAIAPGDVEEGVRRECLQEGKAP